MQIQELLSRFNGVRALGGKDHYIALCPCHDDHKPSLDIRAGDKGFIMSCPVCGADGKTVAQRLGIHVKDLFYQKSQSRPPKPKGTDYYYSDTLKKSRYYYWDEKTQTYKKAFCWRHRQGEKWVKNLPKDKDGRNITPSLYREQNIAAAKREGKTVYIVEGEKDADTLTEKLGFYAVCSPHGAGSGRLDKKWHKEYNALFEGADVAVLSDNDEAGHSLAQYIAAQLLPAARSVRLPDLTFEWEWLPQKGDITDVYENDTPIRGKSIAETVAYRLSALTDITPICQQPQDGKPAYPIWTYGDGDSRKLNEKLFITEFVKEHRVRCINGKLYSAEGAVRDGKAKQMILTEILPYIKTNHGDKAEKLLKGIKQYCYAEPPEPSLDKLHFRNGTLSRDENGLFTVWSDQKEFCINRIAAEYHPYAPDPVRFMRYLEEVYHADDRITLQQYCGYCLLPTTVLQKALFIIGAGGEGKSVIGAILNGILGESNCYNESISVLQKDFGVANVENKLLFVDDDLSEKALESARNFKNLVTNKTVISANKKFVQDNQFKSYVRFLCFGNFTLQALYDTSEGFTRRQLVLEAKPKDRNRIDDPFIDREIIGQEADGVVLWLVNGLNELIRNHFKIYISERTRKVSDQIKRESDSVTLFLDECQDIRMSPELSAQTARLHEIYLDFCNENVITALKAKSFSSALRSKGKERGIRYNPNVFERGKRARGYDGIGIDTDIRFH